MMEKFSASQTLDINPVLTPGSSIEYFWINDLE